MELNVSLSVLISIGGVVAAVASSIAIVKTKISNIEKFVEAADKRIDSLRDGMNRYQSDENVKIALLEQNQEAHARELAELKSDIKTIMNNVQDIKEAVLKVKKGNV